MDWFHPQLIIAVFFHLILGCIFVWDVYCLYFRTADSTVSYVVRGWARDSSSLPLFVGYVLGHLFAGPYKTVDVVHGQVDGKGLVGFLLAVLVAKVIYG